MKNNLKVILLIVAGILFLGILICFRLGYRIPQGDRHKDYVLFPENTDPDFEIEKTNLQFQRIYQIPNFKGFLLLSEEDQYQKAVLISTRGKLLTVLPKTKELFVDSLNHRIIFTQDIIKSDTVFKKRFITFDLKKFKTGSEIEIQDHPIVETFKDFMTRNNYDTERYRQQYEMNAETEAYQKEYEEEALFYQTLYPIRQIAVHEERIDPDFYTNDKGVLFTIENSPLETDNIHVTWDTLFALFPNYKKEISLDLDDKYLDKEIADQPSTYGNGINSGFLRMHFYQYEINYEKVRFGKKTLFFRDKDHDAYSFYPLNKPGYEQDTLMGIDDNTIFRIYLRSNKAIKK